MKFKLKRHQMVVRETIYEDTAVMSTVNFYTGLPLRHGFSTYGLLNFTTTL